MYFWEREFRRNTSKAALMVQSENVCHTFDKPQAPSATYIKERLPKDSNEIRRLLKASRVAARHWAPGFAEGADVTK